MTTDKAREIATPRARKPGKPLRELALDALDDLGVPAAPALIADLTAALTGARPSPSRFASLRRDEENAARRNIAAPGLGRSGHKRPAVDRHSTAALQLVLGELDRRIVGARSIRTDNLRIAISLSGRLAHLREAGASEAKLVERLLFPFARSVPGAVEYGQPIDTARTIEAARLELALIEAPDLEERREAAAKLAGAGPQVRLWGRPVLIDTAAAERAVR